MNKLLRDCESFYWSPCELSICFYIVLSLVSLTSIERVIFWKYCVDFWTIVSFYSVGFAIPCTVYCSKCMSISNEFINDTEYRMFIKL